jgi:uncharacterized protein YyaL (SSP411 family)
MPAIAWLPWSAESFARARSQGKPVLLSITASWCRNCVEMDRTSYADAGVVALVRERFVPIRVDADRRPDVSERYGLGGWPTTAFLTPDGEVLGGGTYVDAGRLTNVLRRVYDAFSEGRHVRAGAVSRSHAAGEPGAATLDQLIDHVGRTFDARHGGFGHSPKFPHVAPVRLALDLYAESRSEEWRDIAITSLDAMGWGPLHDEQAGGFFRYCHDADWVHPNEEKLLDVNAALLSLYVHAFEVLQLARYGERAEDVLRYVQTWLADPVDGGWAGSQRASPCSSPVTGSADPAAAPAVDRTIFADWNGVMVSAALRAGRAMSDTGLSEFAIRSLERVDMLCYRPGAGMAHYYEDLIQPGSRHAAGGPVRGLLDDQIAMAEAHLDAFDATGNIVYEMMAEELALFAMRMMWDDRDGGFFDRAADQRRDIGLLREPMKPFVGNCASARLLRRLATVSGKSIFAGHADRTLAAMSARAAGEGPLAAEYVLAARAPAKQ